MEIMTRFHENAQTGLFQIILKLALDCLGLGCLRA